MRDGWHISTEPVIPDICRLTTVRERHATWQPIMATYAVMDHNDLRAKICWLTEILLAETMYERVSGESSQPFIFYLPLPSLILLYLCLWRRWIRDDRASVQAFSEGERRREGEKRVKGFINTWWFNWFDLVSWYTFLASWAIPLWIGGERIFFSLLPSFLPAPEEFPLCAPLHLVLTHLLWFSSSNTSPPFLTCSLHLFSNFHFLPLIFSISSPVFLYIKI